MQNTEIRTDLVGPIMTGFFGAGVASFGVWLLSFIDWEAGYELQIGDWIGVVPLVIGATMILYCLSVLADRSPKLVFTNEGLINCRRSDEVIRWSDIVHARLATTTNRGSEVSALLTLTVCAPLSRTRIIEINVAGLDQSSGAIHRTICEHANLTITC